MSAPRLSLANARRAYAIDQAEEEYRWVKVWLDDTARMCAWSPAARHDMRQMYLTVAELVDAATRSLDAARNEREGNHENSQTALDVRAGQRRGGVGAVIRDRLLTRKVNS